jgi:hypothetical protein
MPVNDDRFTGGDHFAVGTFERSVHLAMMTNELNGGRGAYRISNAGLGASGPSYGPFQYDLGANARARELFGEIAGSAVDAEDRRIISDEDLGLIRRDLYQPFSDIQSNPVAQATYERFLPAINSALASDAGHRLINDDYVAGIEAKIDSMNAVIAAVPNAANRTFLEQNRLAQLIILDTANQYGPAVNDGLHQFVGMDADSGSMAMPQRRRNPEQISVEGDLGVEDMIRYKLETQYGQTDAGARDVLRRISNLIDAAGPANISISDEDREFLNSGLAQYLTDNGRSVDLTEQALSGLARLGSQPAQTTTTGAFEPTAEVAPRYRTDFDSIFSAVSRDGRWNFDQSNNIAGSLLRNYVADPTMPRLDSVVVGDPTRTGATNIFAVYQPFGSASPFFHASVDAGEAAKIPLRDSLQQLNIEATRLQQQNQQLDQVQVTQTPQNIGPIR